MFELNVSELQDLRSKISTTKVSLMNRNPTKVFTERGLYMLATILHGERARAEGRSAGLEEGEAKGRKEGREEGAWEERFRLARALLANGVEMEVIVASTGLSEEEIKAL